LSPKLYEGLFVCEETEKKTLSSSQSENCCQLTQSHVEANIDLTITMLAGHHCTQYNEEELSAKKDKHGLLSFQST
jgi:hypothetical protein